MIGDRPHRLTVTSTAAPVAACWTSTRSSRRTCGRRFLRLSQAAHAHRLRPALWRKPASTAYFAEIDGPTQARRAMTGVYVTTKRSRCARRRERMPPSRIAQRTARERGWVR